ncbi:MAG: hypothetical protein E6Q06_01575 [Candidatus Moraniibacteriota bacterium]|nr:MAG: hypothetical protein E6Q06_01575 [Candidatus Moranbacteria bacterium]
MRRAILFQPRSGKINEAYERLKAFRRQYQIAQNIGMTYLAENPYFKGYNILIWSALHGTSFLWADEARVFSTQESLARRQRDFPIEFDSLQQRAFLACDFEQAAVPAHQVKWQVLLLLKRIR